MTAVATDNVLERRWPEAGVHHVPYWVYSDADIYKREMERIFCGKAWNYVALDAEIPNSGDYKRSWIGDRPIVVTRDEAGEINAFVNRCAHRGVQFCKHNLGNTNEFICPYHQWTYNLKGNLIGVPLRRGIKNKGGMPADFKREDHGLDILKVHNHNGAVFASFDHEVEPYKEYLGERFYGFMDRVFNGKSLKILGYSRQLIPSNWKLMFENLKDPYHATLLHVFLISFGLFRGDQESASLMDVTGRHAALVNRRGEQKATEGTAEMARMLEDYKLADPRLIDPKKEYDGDATVIMQTLWPNLIMQQQSNSLAMRHIIPRGPEKFELAWTFFGYEDDDEEMVARRLRQANLMGPAGLVSIDDSEVLKMSQDSISPFPDSEGLYEMGGRGTEDHNHIVTETAIRAFYKVYREVMGL
jgi:salicylate 5-hydroxylase large subunit